MRTYRSLWAAALLTSATLLSAAPATTQPAPDPGPWKTTIEQLASPDFPTRQAAAKTLEKATWRDLGLLRKLAQAAPDPEVKAQLLGRVESLEEDLAANPPPISLQLTNATFLDTVNALSKALDTPLQTYDLRSAPHTIHAVDQPFAQVLRDLNEQAALTPDYDGYRVLPGPPLSHGVVAGPLLIYPLAIVYQRSIDYQQPAQAANPTLTLTLQVFIDPRLKIVHAQGMTITSAQDSAGHEMLRTKGKAVLDVAMSNATSLARRMNFPLGWTFPQQVPLDPQTAASQLALLKGTLHLTVEVQHESLVVADLEKADHTRITLAGRPITISKSAVNPQNLLEFQFDMQPLPQNANYTVTIADADDKQIALQKLPGRWESIAGTYRSPIKATFSATTKTRDLQIPFELKKLPLP